jgi:hypothetical protein
VTLRQRAELVAISAPSFTVLDDLHHEHATDPALQALMQHKAFYGCKHRPVDFVVGEWAWLRLLHRPIALLDVKGCGKLGPKFFGPFQVTEKIDDVAYRLQLPMGACLHDVFHVSLLKKFHGEVPTSPRTLPPIWHDRACPTPATVLCSRRA